MICEIDDKIEEEIINAADFEDIVVDSYNNNSSEKNLAAYHFFARSEMPAGSASKRNPGLISTDIPQFNSAKCNGCMECATLCPDSAILAKIINESDIDYFAENSSDDEEVVQILKRQFARTSNDIPLSNVEEKGKLIVAVDPSKCKGCAECVTICKEGALAMIKKNEEVLILTESIFDFFKELPDTESRYFHGINPINMMLSPNALLYTGGAGSCKGCGEATAIRMMLAASGFIYGKENIGIVNTTRCDSAYDVTYPYNPYRVSCTNSTPEKNISMAIGIRERWNQIGWNKKKLWVIADEEILNDTGFQSITKMIERKMDIKILILNRSGYSDKTERIIGQFILTQSNIFVSQVTTSHINFFYKSIIDANEYEGPVIINVYSTCQPQHWVADDMSQNQASLAVNSRVFPLFLYNPEKTGKLNKKLSLEGNPSLTEDWYINTGKNEICDFISFARTEGRFSKLFDADGRPKEELYKLQEKCLKNWRKLQEFSGII